MASSIRALLALFQFTPLREGRPPNALIVRVCMQFQFTPLREGRRKAQQCDHWRAYFNSRPCERGDQQKSELLETCSVFQFTPLREGRRWTGRKPERPDLFQFTPLREGRHPGIGADLSGAGISIHAPARGATFAFLRRLAIHCYFNSRPCERGDHFFCQFFGFFVISIHAPARGATLRGSICSCTGLISIHAPARGATDIFVMPQKHIYISIHAPARGATCSICSYSG